MNILYQGIISFFSVVGFSILFNLPRKLIVAASISGMVGWMVYVLLQNQGTNFIIPAFAGSITVGLIGELFAVIKRHPATLFTIPGIIPFVPGYGIYYTMLYIVEKNFEKAMTTGAESLFIAISIACGIVLATSFVRIIRPFVEKIFKVN
ncbi:MAG: threonine/serine exporter family protein [Firmicutes bacterium]|nr:threonine/serine exporter family protein [Bacillota bacterium]